MNNIIITAQEFLQSSPGSWVKKYSHAKAELSLENKAVVTCLIYSTIWISLVILVG